MPEADITEGSLHWARLVWLWEDDYNTLRPHGSIGNVPPSIYARFSAPVINASGRLTCLGAPRPDPLRHRPQWPQMQNGL